MLIDDRRVALYAALVVVCAAAVAPSAHAAAEWLPVREDSSANPGALVDPGLAFAADGRGVLARLIEGENPTPIYSRLAADGLTFTGHRALGPQNEVVMERYFAAYGSGRLVAARLFLPREHPRVTRQLGVAFGRIGASLGRVRAVGPPRQISIEKVVASPRGNIALATDIDIGPVRRPQQSAVYLAQRRQGRPFRRPVRVSPVGHLLGFDVATSARGDVVVAWRRGDFVEVRVVTANGRRGAIQRLGRAPNPTGIRVAIGRGRRAIVVWESQRTAPGPEPRRVIAPTVVRVASAQAGGRFRPATTVERFVDPSAWLGSCGSFRAVDAAVDDDGNAIAVWTGRSDGRFVLRVATPQGVQVVSRGPGDACVGGVAVGSRGAATIVWSQGNRFSGAEAEAAVRAPGEAAFGEPEVVGAGPVFPPSVAIDPRDGRPFAAWYALDRIRYTSRRTPGS
jgi:hypothetical protein